MEQNYICVDLETTGLDPKRDKIIEIGAVLVEQGKIKKEFSTFLNPGRVLPKRITEITGIVDADLKDAPYIEDKIGEFLEFAGGHILLGHSILFDYSFLKRAAVNARFSYEVNAIDTLQIARKYLAGIPSRSLPNLCEFYGIEYKPHRALEDAIATHKLYQKLLEEFYREETAIDFTSHALQYRVKREGPITAAQRERLLRMCSMHKIDLEYDVNRLTKNEASRMIDKIILQYGREG